MADGRGAPTEEAGGNVAVAPRRKFPKHLVEIYTIGKMLGTGASSTVWEATKRSTGEVRAVKRIDASEISAREIAHEIALMKLLQHDCVVRCYDVFLEAQYVNIVVDMFTGGDLVDGLNAHRKARGRVPDAQLAHLLRQMVAAVSHVHGLRIVHRDIKGENFLSDRPDIGDPACRVALADFGTAKRIEPGLKLEDRVGTPAFWGPEVWKGSYGFAVDVWALGVTTFILLSGTLPFEGGEEAICRPTAPGEPSATVPYYTSRGCSDFIANCLVKDPLKRPTAAQVSRHDWLSTPLPTSGGGGNSIGMPQLPAAPTTEQVSKTATIVLDSFVDGLAAVVMGCCSGFGLCLDLLFGSAEVAQKQREAQRGRDNLEKEVTELSKRITKNTTLQRQVPNS